MSKNYSWMYHAHDTSGYIMKELILLKQSKKNYFYICRIHCDKSNNRSNFLVAAKRLPELLVAGLSLETTWVNFIFALTTNFEHCFAFKAEVMALTRGLELTRDLQIERLEVQLDSLTSVQSLMTKNDPTSACAHDQRYCHAVENEPNSSLS